MKETVLIVDDAELMRSVYTSKLLSEGYNVKTAVNGVDAIKQLSAAPPDIVLLDLVMPIVDGYKVLQAMKADPKLARIPVIVFSGKGATDEIAKATAAGASGFLIKATTNPNKVVEKVKEALANRSKPG